MYSGGQDGAGQDDVGVPVIDRDSLRDRVDVVFYSRGEQYARQHAVAQLRWDPSRSALQGLVRGSAGAFYTTIALFSGAGQRPLEFERGVCSCPVGSDCKHVVALVLTAAGPAPAPASVPRPAEPRPPAWAASLESLLGPGPGPVASPRPQTPLAIELTLTRGDRRGAPRWPPPAAPAPKLTARLVQPGQNDRWIAGPLTWSRLDSLSYYGHYDPAQVRLLQEIYALYQSGSARHGYYGYYGHGDEKSIDVGAFESVHLWPMLDAAESAGVPLLRARKLGQLRGYSDAELVLDVTSPERPDGSSSMPPEDYLLVTPVIRLSSGAPEPGGAARIEPILFIGTAGHGLVYAHDPPEKHGAEPGARFHLARLSRSVPEQLQRMALDGQRLQIPAAEHGRFRDEYYPRLRRAVTVASSDGSFEPPLISGPTLVLKAAYLPGHRVDIGWDWAYQVGDSHVRLTVGLDPAAGGAGDGGAGLRDIAAEQALLAGLDAPLEGFGLAEASQAGRVIAPRVILEGIATMRFTTELLPLLAGQAGMSVEVAGEHADYREAGDSLRIAVSAGDVAGDSDWFDLGVTMTVDGKDVPFTDLFVALSRGESHLLLADGAYFSLDKPELQALARLIEEARALQDAPPGELRISRFQAGLWEELAGLGVVSHQAAAWREHVQGLLSLTSVPARPAPAGMRAQLRPYQLDGFGWLAFLWEHQLGGILADDMGLGKTLQTLALICHARRAGAAGPPFLIVAPTSVVPNWAAEASKFAPQLTVVPISETGARRGAALADVVAGADAVVTSYTLLRLDADFYAALDWAGLILDEAQFVKNHQSKVYQCVRRLPAPFKLAITGTPMENNLMELWSLLSVTAPGMFPSPARFRDYYARPIERTGDAELLAQLRRRIKPLVKRRTKEQVATDLPAKQEQVIEVDLHPRHRKVYQMHLQRERQKVLHLIDDLSAHRFTIFRSLTLLRQLSLHAGLVDEALADLPSSKVDLLVEQLADVIGGGHRALVFSQFTGFLAKVRERLDAEGVPYCYLDGKTRDRAGELDRFKGGTAPVFLISLKAGGFGLNLTEADYCFLLDPWWNPATEAQAVDRTHRIGQTRNVMVYRLIARDTIEQKVMALKASKAQLFASVLDEGNVFAASLDAADVRALFD